LGEKASELKNVKVLSIAPLLAKAIKSITRRRASLRSSFEGQTLITQPLSRAANGALKVESEGNYG